METLRHCELCKRTGLVTVYHPLDVRAIRENVSMFRDRAGRCYGAGVNDCGMPRNALAAVPCKCSLGDRHALWFYQGDRQPERLPRFGESPNHVQPSHMPVQEGQFANDVAEASRPVEWEF